MTSSDAHDHEWRDKPISHTERNASFFAFGTLFLIIGILIGATWFGDDTPIIRGNGLGYFTNLFTEAISIVVTVGLFGIFAEMRRIQLRKQELIRNAGKRSNAVAVDAVDDLRYFGWLVGEDGLLRDANLASAHLAGANLRWANLQGVDLRWSNLSHAHLRWANLQGADLWGANLQGAHLRWANLQDSHLCNTDFTGAYLWNTNLTGAIFQEEQSGTVYTATMPNGEKWHPGMDLEIFTNPEHPQFYHP